MQGITYLDLLCDLVQIETLESSQSNELIYPVHDDAFVIVISPKSVRDGLGHDGATEGRYISRRAGHIRKTGLLITAVPDAILVNITVTLGWGAG
jgi:hypothetical protein